MPGGDAQVLSLALVEVETVECRRREAYDDSSSRACICWQSSAGTPSETGTRIPAASTLQS